MPGVSVKSEPEHLRRDRAIVNLEISFNHLKIS